MKAPVHTTTLSILGVVFFLIFLNIINLLTPLKVMVRVLTEPIVARVYTTGITIHNYGWFKNKQELQNALTLCETDRVHGNITEANYLLLQSENEELKKQLHFTAHAAVPHITTLVISKNIDGINKTITVDRGADASIAVHDPVIVGDGILIGQVIAVEPDVAIVRLLSDTESKIATIVLNDKKSSGVIEGGYGVSLYMNFIPRNEIVETGQSVVTSQLLPAVPAGLLVGSISAVENEAYQPFQRATVSPAIDFTKLYIVTVLHTASSTTK